MGVAEFIRQPDSEGRYAERFTGSRSIFELFDLWSERTDPKQIALLSINHGRRIVAMHPAIIRPRTIEILTVGPRLFFAITVPDHPAGVVLLQNRLSEWPEASTNDRAMTEAFRREGKRRGVPLMDHIIIGNDCYYSFADDRRL